MPAAVAVTAEAAPPGALCRKQLENPVFTRHFSKKNNQIFAAKEGTKSQQARERGEQTKPSRERVERGNSALCHQMRKEDETLQGKLARY